MSSKTFIKASRRKVELLAALTTNREAILRLAAGLPTGQHQTVYLGKWCLLDMLAHLIGWDIANRQAIEALQAGMLPEFYGQAGKHWRIFNDRLVEQYRQNDLETLIADAGRSHQALRGCFETVDPLDIDRDFGVRYRGYRVTIGRLLDSEIADENEHAGQLSAFISTLATP